MVASSKTPVVSVIIPSYNHGRFIRECIDSVLTQTFQSFEIIITDDSSTDDTVDVIKGYKDPRIQLFVHAENKGACIAANHCIRQSKGKYIAMLSSDDAWYPEKLAIQVKYMEDHPNIASVFGKVDWIDENSNFITSDEFPYKDVFEVENRTRHEWLGRFFKVGNCLCHPCSLIRREPYFDVGLLNPAFAILPDFDLWIRLCLKYDIHILDQRLVYFRRTNEEINASGDNPANRLRNRFEYKQILNNYLRIQDPNDFLLAFPEAVNYGKVSKDLIPYFLGRIAIDRGIDFFMLWGLETIYNNLKDNRVAKELEISCGFTYLDFIKMSGKYDPYGISNYKAVPTLPAKILSPEPTIIVRRSRLFLISSKNFLKNFVSATRYLLAALSKYVKDIYAITLNPNHSQNKLKLPESTDKISFSIDNLEPASSDQNLYRLSGWTSQEEKGGQSDYERLLVLKSSTRTFLYPVTSLNNPDEQKVSGSPEKDFFCVVLSKAVILPDVYTLGILFRQQPNHDGQYTVADKALVHAAGRLQLESTTLIYQSQISRIKSFIAAVKIHIKDI